MNYVLETKNACVKYLRKKFPMDQEAIDRVKRVNLLFLREAVLLHYEINPFLAVKISLEKVAEIADPFYIVDSFRRSCLLGEIQVLRFSGLREPVRKKEYSDWAAKNGLSLPAYLIEEFPSWEMPKLATEEDVKKIDYSSFSGSVIAAFGANIFARGKKMANPQVKISEVYNSSIVTAFLKDCAVIDGKDAIKSQSTIRKYIQNQFLD